MRLKVCGMKYPDNIEQVASLQPDYLGFIFYEKSKRYFVENNIPKLPNTIKKVGVFVDADIDMVIEKITIYNLQAVQLHGHESPEYCKKLKRHYEFISESHDKNLKLVQIKDKIEIIKAFSIDESFNFDALKPFEAVCDYFLFDTKGKLPGGNGYTFDWNVLKNYTLTKPFFLSGGIGLNETEKVLSFLQKQESKYCYALDVNSQFEIEPGLKNIEELKEFKNQINAKH
ncbi:phosphoribosylanthranilate isomerase [Flavobacteriaceae bacterium XHP0103]|uniref:phosphoribosylanthranilate isomerase n=1 Tax=Marixanthotalea marina TaxID=2844359 RepID=UPI002989DEE4|nr:phosphoribosylanthranilate isomerase [Marixanthotalea marina]MBU3821142.1 phosphoribosylanthranilate isomerase [Marixanthotalea marina]